jgi:hypothetical protein
MTKRIITILVFASAAVAVAQAFRQPPFFGPTPTSYDAVIAVVPSPTSYNPPRKTAGGPPVNSPFSFQISPGGGFVGSALPGAAPTILDKPGMTLIEPLAP